MLKIMKSTKLVLKDNYVLYVRGIYKDHHHIDCWISGQRNSARTPELYLYINKD